MISHRHACPRTDVFCVIYLTPASRAFNYYSAFRNTQLG